MPLVKLFQKATETPAPPVDMPCAFVWAYHALDAETDALLQALANANLSEVEGYVEGFGEDCVNAQGISEGFGVMEAKLRLYLTVTDVADLGQVGNRVAEILPVLIALPSDATHSAAAVEILYKTTQQSDAEYQFINFSLEQANQAVLQGLAGEALITFLQTD